MASGCESRFPRRRRRLRAATSPAQRALGLYPAHTFSLVKLGELLEDERRDYDAAEALYRRAAAINPHCQ